MKKTLASLLLALPLAGCSQADLQKVGEALQTAGQGTAGEFLTERDIAAGLKEALSKGTERSISRIGVPDGFWKNPGLQIPLPESLQKIEKTARTLGMGRKVDEFHLSLNRAAEKAVPEAASVFGDAIRGMTLADARGILRGPDNAATSYFREKTSGELTRRFLPIVTKATESVGATRKYKELTGKVSALVPGLEVTDVDAYVTERALAGLFSTLAEEEKKIRDDPAARTTELLKKVFGSGP